MFLAHLWLYLFITCPDHSCPGDYGSDYHHPFCGKINWPSKESEKSLQANTLTEQVKLFWFSYIIAEGHH